MTRIRRKSKWRIAAEVAVFCVVVTTILVVMFQNIGLAAILVVSLGILAALS